MNPTREECEMMREECEMMRAAFKHCIRRLQGNTPKPIIAGLRKG